MGMTPSCSPFSPITLTSGARMVSFTLYCLAMLYALRDSEIRNRFAKSNTAPIERQIKLTALDGANLEGKANKRADALSLKLVY